jgi:hypothetical protein
MKHLFLTLAVLAVLAWTVNAQTNSTYQTYCTNAIDDSFYSMTGAVVRVTNWCDRIPTSEKDQAARDLSKGGVICRVFGHSWPSFYEFSLYVINQMSLTGKRTCRICGKTETKTEGDWK